MSDEQPVAAALTPPYPAGPGRADVAAGPLARLLARSGSVPFVARDELTTLLGWAADAATGPAGVRIAVVEGPAGSGKTRLAAELAARLADDGWHAGFLDDVRAETAERLADGTAPLLVVVDDAAAVHTDALVRLVAALAARAGAAAVILTARTRGEWWTGLSRGLSEATLPVSVHPPVALPAQHPGTVAVFRAARDAFCGAESGAEPVVDDRWSTFDLVALATLAAAPPGAGPESLPGNRADLYEAVLAGELRHWGEAAAVPAGTSTASLRAAAACVALLSPTERQLAAALSGAGTEGDGAADGGAAALAHALAGLLAGPDGTLVLRPAAVADHLVVGFFPTEPDRYAGCVASIDTDAAAQRFCDNLTRAGEPSVRDLAMTPGTSIADRTAQGRRAEVLMDLSTAALLQRPDLWEAGYAVALRRGGAIVAGLEILAGRDDTPVALDRLAVEIPVGHDALRTLAIVAAERHPAAARDAGDGPADGTRLPAEATTLRNLGIRLSEVGRRADALAPTRGAADRYRRLADTDPDRYLPDLAHTLTDLGHLLAEAGDAGETATVRGEAAERYRRLADTDPDRYLPDLAGSLNNLGVVLAELGRHDDALPPATEAVEHFRQLADADPDGYLPDLAGSLSNLGDLLAAMGDHARALEPAGDAVDRYRRLADADPDRYLPDLAGSLNNLGVVLAELDRDDDALPPATEAVQRYQDLAGRDPETYLPDLAGSSVNLAELLTTTGHPMEATTPAGDAVNLYRQLTEQDAGYLPALMGALTDLADLLDGTGQGDEAAAVFERAWQGLAVEQQVDLMVARARWRAAHGDPGGRAADLLAAVATAEGTTAEAPGADAAGAGRADGGGADEAGAGTDRAAGDGGTGQRARARRTVRRALMNAADDCPGLLDDAPDWAVRELPDEVIDLIDRAAATGTWDEAAALLRGENGARLLTPEIRPVRDALAVLFADQPEVVKILRILDTADVDGLDVVLDRLCDGEEHARLLRAWLATPTWLASQQYLASHQELLKDPRTLLALTDGDDPRLRQHAAIVQLATEAKLPLDKIYRLASDVDAAARAVTAAAEEGDRERVAAMWQAAPQLSGRPFVGAYAVAVLAALDGDVDEAREAATAAAGYGSEADRDGGARRLRRLAARRPKRAPELRELADLLERPAEAGDTVGTR